MRNDTDLVRRIAAGDQEALSALHTQYVNLVYSMALYVTKEPAIAEEVAQDVFMTIWRRAELYDESKGSFSTWVLTITRRRAIDALRRTRPTTRIADLPPHAEPAQLDATADIDLQRALAELPEEQRRCIDLVYFGGLRQHEVAEQLDMPLGTVKSRIRLAMNRLRQLLGPHD